MSSVYASRPLRQPPIKRRRTATSVFAGDFDPRPSRDVLTSLLNGVGPYKEVEKDKEERKMMRREQKERDRERIRQKRLLAAKEQVTTGHLSSRPSASSLPLLTIPGGNMPKNDVPTVNTSTSFFWRSRGPVLSPPRSISPSPPLDSGYPLTPGPSDSSYDSRTSSKRPHTPDDDYLLYDQSMDSPPPGEMHRPRKKRVAARKGWKGWVEGSPPPSDKLINLDFAPVLRERRLRSGKNFDAICEGQDSWITPVADH
ncbi:hypothetical protein SCHPADRAFT_996621 [Schizopora paradoxa]|uniref:Uncharacterized protein n=1 Tax=Schizopora paradoxa TaxID=27342 RepID=A0A0H2RR55_9AGAM|nr:hypothetical protein SCHPADRAFT_996621 [Schizopora paradoxa]